MKFVIDEVIFRWSCWYKKNRIEKGGFGTRPYGLMRISGYVFGTRRYGLMRISGYVFGTRPYGPMRNKF